MFVSSHGLPGRYIQLASIFIYNPVNKLRRHMSIADILIRYWHLLSKLEGCKSWKRSDWDCQWQSRESPEYSTRAQIHVTPHTLKRTFAILALRAGLSLIELQAYLGHSSLDMTQRYIEMLDDDLLDARREHGPVDCFLYMKLSMRASTVKWSLLHIRLL